MPIHSIESRHNEQLKRLRLALRQGERSPEGWLAVETFHLLEEALRSRLETPQAFFTLEAEAEVVALFRRYHAAPALFRVPGRVFEAISPAPASQGVAAFVKPRSWKVDDLFNPAPALVVVLAGVQDPGNAGTVLRTAEAFGATGLMMLHGSVHPENPKLLRASAGSAFRLPHLHGLKIGQALEELRARSITLYAAIPRAPHTLEEVDFGKPLAVAIGAEGTGVPEALAAGARGVAIPNVRKVESLNAAVAAAIFLYQAAAARAGVKA